MSTARKKKATFWSNVKELAVLLLIVFIIRTIGFGLYQVPTGSMETTMLVGERFFADKFTPLFSKIKRGEVIAFNDPTWKYSKNRFKRLFEEYVWGPYNWTKRVIGAPGDTVRGTIEDGKPVIYVNEEKIDEPYLNKYPLVKVWSVDPRQVPLLISRKKISGERLFTTKSFDPNISFDNQPFYYIDEKRIARGGELGPPFLYPGTPVRPSETSKRYRVGNSYWTGSDEFHVELGPNQYWVMGDNRLGSTDSRWFGPIDGRLIHSRIMFCVLSVDTQESWLFLDLLKNPIDFWRRIRWGRIPRKVH